MRNWPELFLVLVLVFPLSAAGADSENGRILHDSNCTRCHGKDMYTRPGRTIDSLQALQKRVHQCVLMADLPWFEEEIEDVVEYLNVYFYNFEMK